MRTITKRNFKEESKGESYYHFYMKRRTRHFFTKDSAWYDILNFLLEHDKFSVNELRGMFEKRNKGTSTVYYYLMLLQHFGYVKKVISKVYKVVDKKRVRWALQKHMLLNYNYKKNQ